jgi:hypothetical protein
MNAIFLLKEELQYKPCIRGMEDDAHVQTLRNVFRSVLSAELPVDLILLLTEDLCGSVSSNIIELQNLVTQPTLTVSLLTLRLRTWISHLMGHLKHLTNLGWFALKITISCNQ